MQVFYWVAVQLNVCKIIYHVKVLCVGHVGHVTGSVTTIAENQWQSPLQIWNDIFSSTWVHMELCTYKWHTVLINTIFMFQRATTNKGVVLILCIFPSLCNIAHSSTINMHTALIYMHIDRQTCPILCIICPCGKNLSVQQESQRLTLQDLQLRRWRLLSSSGCLMISAIFFRNSDFGTFIGGKTDVSYMACEFLWRF